MSPPYAGGSGPEGGNHSSDFLSWWVVAIVGPLFIAGSAIVGVGWGVICVVRWLFPYVKRGLLALLRLLLLLALEAVSQIKNRTNNKGGKIMDPEIVPAGEDTEQLLAAEVREITADWGLPVLRGYTKKELRGAEESVMASVLASLKGRFEATTLMKYRAAIIRVLAQEKVLIDTDIAKSRAVFDRILLREDLSYELKERRQGHELNTIKQSYKIARVKHEIAQLNKQDEPEEVEVIDEAEALYKEVEEEIERMAKRERLRGELRSKAVEKALKQMRERIRQIELNPELEDEDKERLKEELKEETDYTIHQMYERRTDE